VPFEYTDEQFIAAIKDSRGIVKVVAERVGCEWQTAQNHIQKSPRLKLMMRCEREALIDVAEGHLFDMVEDKDRWAIGKVLHTLGRDRGYDLASNKSQETDATVKIIKGASFDDL
jgi:hypothetical protein